MKELEERILKDGIVLNNEILKVDSFINHQIDTGLLFKISSYLADKFKDKKISKIVTIETSGIAFAIGVASMMGNIPVVFAKKSKSAINDTKNVYTSEIVSFTRKISSTVTIDKRYICKDDHCLIIDDFMAEGNASLGLIGILNQAGAKCEGIGIVIEKKFQGAREKLNALGYEVHSAAVIKEFRDNKPVFEED